MQRPCSCTLWCPSITRPVRAPRDCASWHGDWFNVKNLEFNHQFTDVVHIVTVGLVVKTCTLLVTLWWVALCQKEKQRKKNKKKDKKQGGKKTKEGERKVR